MRSCKADKAGFELSRTFASQSVTFSVCRLRWSLRRPLPCRKPFTESRETCCERREGLGAHTDPQRRPESSRSDGSAGKNPSRDQNAFPNLLRKSNGNPSQKSTVSAGSKSVTFLPLGSFSMAVGGRGARDKSQLIHCTDPRGGWGARPANGKCHTS